MRLWKSHGGYIEFPASDRLFLFSTALGFSRARPGRAPCRPREQARTPTNQDLRSRHLHYLRITPLPKQGAASKSTAKTAKPLLFVSLPRGPVRSWPATDPPLHTYQLSIVRPLRSRPCTASADWIAQHSDALCPHLRAAIPPHAHATDAAEHNPLFSAQRPLVREPTDPPNASGFRSEGHASSLGTPPAGCQCPNDTAHTDPAQSRPDPRSMPNTGLPTQPTDWAPLHDPPDTPTTIPGDGRLAAPPPRHRLRRRPCTSPNTFRHDVLPGHYHVHPLWPRDLRRHLPHHFSFQMGKVRPPDPQATPRPPKKQPPPQPASHVPDNGIGFSGISGFKCTIRSSNNSNCLFCLLCDAWTPGSVCDALSMMVASSMTTLKNRDKPLGLTGARKGTKIQHLIRHRTRPPL